MAKRPGYKIQIPLMVLAVLSLVGGFVNLPPELGNEPLFTRLLDTALPPVESRPLRSAYGNTFRRVPDIGIPYRSGSRVSVLPSPPRVVGRSDRNWCGKSHSRVLACRLGIRLVLRQTVRTAVLWFARMDKDDVADEPFTTGSGISVNSCTAVLGLRKTAGYAGTPLESRRGPSYLWRLSYSYDSALADRHFIGGRPVGMDGRQFERLGVPLDLVDRGECGLCDRTSGLDP